VIDPDIAAIEAAAFDAWPAAEVRSLGPWRLRFMSGVTNRANSAWAGPGDAPPGIEARIAAVERFYRERQLPAMFQMTPLSDPRLDDLLAARGYEKLGTTSVQVADAAHVAALSPRAGISAACEPRLPEAWFEISGHRGRFRGRAAPVYRGLLDRLSGRCGFASAVDASGAIAAVGLAVLAPPLAGIFSMLTLPERRGRGYGEALLGELARFAAARGARRLYLQVECDNAPALALYARAGFAETHRYHYRRC
jgi:ribosomal protein S18 acetylase RimI-like enzyme